jgi:hypothetical protein
MNHPEKVRVVLEQANQVTATQIFIDVDSHIPSRARS